MYCRNSRDSFGSIFLFYHNKKWLFWCQLSIDFHESPLGSQSDPRPRQHTLLSHGLCYKNGLKKKIVHFSNCCQISKNCFNFKKLTVFGILWIRRGRIQNQWFWTSPRWFSKNCKNSGPFLRNLLKIARNRQFANIWRRIQIGKNLRIPKMVNFSKLKQFLAIWQPFEKWTIFSNPFL